MRLDSMRWANKEKKSSREELAVGIRAGDVVRIGARCRDKRALWSEMCGLPRSALRAARVGVWRRELELELELVGLVAGDSKRALLKVRLVSPSEGCHGSEATECGRAVCGVQCAMCSGAGGVRRAEV